MGTKSLLELKKEYTNLLKIDNYSTSTINSEDNHLKYLLDYLKKFHKITTPNKINKLVLEGYVDFVKKLRSKNTGKPLYINTIISICWTAKKFCDYLLANELLCFDYFTVFEMKRPKKGIPKNILTQEQMKKVLALPNESTYLGFRDKVIFELMYNTGMRRMEVVGLDVYDINYEDKSIFIEQGKGKKDRIVPIGDYLEKYLKVYIQFVRPVLVNNVDETALFCNSKGCKMLASSLSSLVSKYSKQVDFNFSCHTFRHSMATHLLKNGADILYIQRILGHEHATTTEIYTRVYPLELKKVISEMHPRSNIRLAEEEITLPTKMKNTQRKYLDVKLQDKE